MIPSEKPVEGDSVVRKSRTTVEEETEKEVHTIITRVEKSMSDFNKRYPPEGDGKKRNWKKVSASRKISV